MHISFKRLLLCLPLLLGFLISPIQAQTDTTKYRFGWLEKQARKMLADTAAPGEPRFLAYPTVGYAPETSLEIGVSAVRLFHARREATNRLSEIRLFAFFTLESQYGIWLDHDIYGHEDKWFFLGQIRQQRFPLLYFGIGPNTLEEDAVLIDANYTKLRERVLRRVAPNLFVGFESDFQLLYNVNFEEEFNPMPLGSEGSLNLGLGLGMVYDNRHNVLNVREGVFAELAFLEYLPAFGSDFSFREIYLDSRYYIPITRDKSQVLAMQFQASSFVRDVPFNHMALLGGEQMMRGYYTGRYRDKNLVAFQAEYRFLPFPLSFTDRIGGAVFVATGMVAPRVQDFQLKNLLPTGGFGLRYLLFKQKDIYVRFDVAFTEEGPGFYFFTGEAF
ncbi:BamA/TamA family outer membrane protein [Pontibacter sp. G13]|uniref:BamA/TamA family outer membrane protein n=1 Tax=Pontibacter sp. G13 TaxID=3074898 RepID=UPI00288B69EC|nr:BamA/TamA family outer membrane protein [Pontibacter sp. G13]WNJ17534.1 BamA/TamA family outer membrane protein [Pontibacter sp. G13]